MSAAQIPNLHTLRQGGLRGRGRGGNLSQPGQQSGRSNKDDIIRHTDNDAATSRLSAVEAGYLDDPFAKLLSSGDEVARRLPLMNRGGTYTRTTGIDRIVDQFLSQLPGRKQIISLGAGSDTRYFRIKRRRPDVDLTYHELDFVENTRNKIARLRSPAFSSTAQELCATDFLSPDFQVLDDDTRLISPSYSIHPQDLRLLHPDQTAVEGLDKSLPTLLISECCLIYLAPDDALKALQYFTTLLCNRPLAVVIYEPIRPHDAFGKTMVSNLTARGIHLQTLEKYADLTEQKQRLLDHGFAAKAGGGAEAVDIEWVWKNWVNEREKERIDGLEWMDEVEEFVLLAQHYCIAWGWKGWEVGNGWTDLMASPL